jgi:hypothetical protein
MTDLKSDINFTIAKCFHNIAVINSDNGRLKEACQAINSARMYFGRL